MKHLRKITLLFAVFALLFSISCGSDDETTVDLSDVEFSFDVQNPPVDLDLIQGLQETGDVNAGFVAGQLSLANGMSAYLSFIAQSEGASSSSTPIGSCLGEAIVYTFTSNFDGETVGFSYQICETSDKYIFQMFISDDGTTFEEFIYAEESKSDLRKGYMEVYDVETSETIAIFEWEEMTDGSLDFVYRDTEDTIVLAFTVNSNNSGELTLHNDSILEYEASWTANGASGSYTYYNTDGTVSSEGNWSS